jgi:hypothetical protein
MLLAYDMFGASRLRPFWKLQPVLVLVALDLRPASKLQSVIG